MQRHKIFGTFTLFRVGFFVLLGPGGGGGGFRPRLYSENTKAMKMKLRGKKSGWFEIRNLS